MNDFQWNIDSALRDLEAQRLAVSRNHVHHSPREHDEACLVQRKVGSSVYGVLTLHPVALRALAWVMAEERRVIIRPADELAACLGSINDAEFTQDAALWFLGRAQTLLEKFQAYPSDGQERD